MASIYNKDSSDDYTTSAIFGPRLRISSVDHGSCFQRGSSKTPASSPSSTSARRYPSRSPTHRIDCTASLGCDAQLSDSSYFSTSKRGTDGSSSCCTCDASVTPRHSSPSASAHTSHHTASSVARSVHAVSAQDVDVVSLSAMAPLAKDVCGKDDGAGTAHDQCGDQSVSDHDECGQSPELLPLPPLPIPPTLRGHSFFPSHSQKPSVSSASVSDCASQRALLPSHGNALAPSGISRATSLPADVATTSSNHRAASATEHANALTSVSAQAGLQPLHPRAATELHAVHTVPVRTDDCDKTSDEAYVAPVVPEGDLSSDEEVIVSIINTTGPYLPPACALEAISHDTIPAHTTAAAATDAAEEPGATVAAVDMSTPHKRPSTRTRASLSDAACARPLQSLRTNSSSAIAIVATPRRVAASSPFLSLDDLNKHPHEVVAQRIRRDQSSPGMLMELPAVGKLPRPGSSNSIMHHLASLGAASVDAASSSASAPDLLERNDPDLFDRGTSVTSSHSATHSDKLAASTTRFPAPVSPTDAALIALNAHDVPPMPLHPSFLAPPTSSLEPIVSPANVQGPLWTAQEAVWRPLTGIAGLDSHPALAALSASSHHGIDTREESSPLLRKASTPVATLMRTKSVDQSARSSAALVGPRGSLTSSRGSVCSCDGETTHDIVCESLRDTSETPQKVPSPRSRLSQPAGTTSTQTPSSPAQRPSLLSAALSRRSSSGARDSAAPPSNDGQDMVLVAGAPVLLLASTQPVASSSAVDAADALPAAPTMPRPSPTHTYLSTSLPTPSPVFHEDILEGDGHASHAAEDMESDSACHLPESPRVPAGEAATGTAWMRHWNASETLPSAVLAVSAPHKALQRPDDMSVPWSRPGPSFVCSTAAPSQVPSAPPSAAIRTAVPASASPSSTATSAQLPLADTPPTPLFTRTLMQSIIDSSVADLDERCSGYQPSVATSDRQDRLLSSRPSLLDVLSSMPSHSHSPSASYVPSVAPLSQCLSHPAETRSPSQSIGAAISSVHTIASASPSGSAHTVDSTSMSPPLPARSIDGSSDTPVQRDGVPSELAGMCGARRPPRLVLPTTSRTCSLPASPTAAAPPIAPPSMFKSTVSFSATPLPPAGRGSLLPRRSSAIVFPSSLMLDRGTPKKPVPYQSKQDVQLTPSTDAAATMPGPVAVLTTQATPTQIADSTSGLPVTGPNWLLPPRPAPLQAASEANRELYYGNLPLKPAVPSAPRPPSTASTPAITVTPAPSAASPAPSIPTITSPVTTPSIPAIPAIPTSSSLPVFPPYSATPSASSVVSSFLRPVASIPLLSRSPSTTPATPALANPFLPATPRLSTSTSPAIPPIDASLSASSNTPSFLLPRPPPRAHTITPPHRQTTSFHSPSIYATSDSSTPTYIKPSFLSAHTYSSPSIYATTPTNLSYSLSSGSASAGTSTLPSPASLASCSAHAAPANSEANTSAAPAHTDTPLSPVTPVAMDVSPASASTAAAAGTVSFITPSRAPLHTSPIIAAVSPASSADSHGLVYRLNAKEIVPRVLIALPMTKSESAPSSAATASSGPASEALPALSLPPTAPPPAAAPCSPIPSAPASPASTSSATPSATSSATSSSTLSPAVHTITSAQPSKLSLGDVQRSVAYGEGLYQPPPTFMRASTVSSGLLIPQPLPSLILDPSSPALSAATGAPGLPASSTVSSGGFGFGFSSNAVGLSVPAAAPGLIIPSAASAPLAEAPTPTSAAASPSFAALLPASSGYGSVVSVSRILNPSIPSPSAAGTGDTLASAHPPDKSPTSPLVFPILLSSPSSSASSSPPLHPVSGSAALSDRVPALVPASAPGPSHSSAESALLRSVNSGAHTQPHTRGSSGTAWAAMQTMMYEQAVAKAMADTRVKHSLDTQKQKEEQDAHAAAHKDGVSSARLDITTNTAKGGAAPTSPTARAGDAEEEPPAASSFPDAHSPKSSDSDTDDSMIVGSIHSSMRVAPAAPLRTSSGNYSNDKSFTAAPSLPPTHPWSSSFVSAFVCPATTASFLRPLRPQPSESIQVEVKAGVSASTVSVDLEDRKRRNAVLPPLLPLGKVHNFNASGKKPEKNILFASGVGLDVDVTGGKSPHKPRHKHAVEEDAPHVREDGSAPSCRRSSMSEADNIYVKKLASALMLGEENVHIGAGVMLRQPPRNSSGESGDPATPTKTTPTPSVPSTPRFHSQKQAPESRSPPGHGAPHGTTLKPAQRFTRSMIQSIIDEAMQQDGEPKKKFKARKSDLFANIITPVTRTSSGLSESFKKQPDGSPAERCRSSRKQSPQRQSPPVVMGTVVDKNQGRSIIHLNVDDAAPDGLIDTTENRTGILWLPRIINYTFF